ncbi:hypothetical protein UA08_00562 [Talaromyces atroroseus]|uniref:Leptomycin B resistance protein pmd1 n=1 Tax=Talaromyces atroroseus TaxID=1441469 RepID=A0A225BB22_TALAT|nr:hypothetical protein UA08_00562 [Talaromyces atroroseus]OKL64606.1 hypothetical protein UA08_00562 [Talaromyces atroroseus]
MATSSVRNIEAEEVPERDSSVREKDPSDNVELDYLDQQLHFEDVKLSFIGIYSYATRIDLCLVAISTVFAVIGGALIPVTPIISSRIILIFSEAESQGDEFRSQLDRYTVYYVYIVVAALVTWFLSTAGFNYTGARITRTIRLRYFESMLKQNMAVFDDKGTGNILSQLTDDTKAIQEAISSAISDDECSCMDWILMFEPIWSLAVGYAVLYIGGKLTVRYSSQSIEASSAGSAIIEEALGSIKTTTSLGIQEHIHGTYMSFLAKAAKKGVIVSSLNSILIAICVACGYMNVALAFWQGSRRLTENKTSFTAVVAIAMVTKSAAFCVLGVGSNMEAFAAALAGARRLSSMIWRVSPLDSSSDQGSTPDQYNATMDLQNVKHVYPCRPKITVLNDVSIKLPMGKTTAIVGHSGSGKSSISNMLQRFYDLLAGRVLLDGKDLSYYQLRWLRQQIAVVRQESFMFNKSVFDNIALGFTGPQWKTASQDKIREAVEKAAETAQVSDFISKLPQGYDTIVGTRGSRLSGRQLQRIAIARAIVNNPRILILDEATSALDSETEARLLSALTQEDKRRTTIVIAHRLSTVRNADNIVVLNAGRVVESGKHDALIAARSSYYDLVNAQNVDYHNQGTTDEVKEQKSEKTAFIDTASQAATQEDNSGQGSHGSISISTTAEETSSSIFSMISFIFNLNKGELHWLLIGLICCIIAGGEEPASAVLFGEAISALAQPVDQTERILSQAAFYSWMFLTLALVMLISCAAQGIAFAFSSENLTNRVRSIVLQKYLRMDISFFDKKENSAAALSSFLSSSTSDLTGLSGSALGIILICVSTLISGVVLSLALGWKLALVCFAVIPLMIGGGYFGVYLVAEFQKKNEIFAKDVAEFAGETLNGI